MIKLIGDGHVLIEEFQTEEEALAYKNRNREELMTYFSHYEVVVPGEKTIWSVSENLIPAEDYIRDFKEKLKARINSRDDQPEEGWGDEEEE